jgi:YD repeat-containing protein
VREEEGQAGFHLRRSTMTFWSNSLRISISSAKQIFFVLAVLFVLLFAGRSEAQQVCYSYDALGRLVGVVDQNQQAAFYDYDAVGNILSIRRQSPSGPVTIYSVDPPSGSTGTLIEIFGLGFSQTANQNVVTIGGVSIPVVSVTGCTLVGQLPNNATTGQLTVTTPLGTATSSQVFTPFSMTIPLTATAVSVNGTVQFTTIITGCSDPRVVWSVNGIIGGNSVVGTISAAGLYVAPATVPTPAQVTIRADSVGCANLFAEVPLVVGEALQSYASTSVSYGTPVPPPLPANVIFDDFSVVYGTPLYAVSPSTIMHFASVAEAPFITSMSASSASRGTSNIPLTISGANLQGAFDLEFHLSTGADSQIVTTNVVVNPTGTSLTANVSVSGTASLGAHIVVVKAPVVNSIYANTGVNAFTIK